MMTDKDEITMTAAQPSLVSIEATIPRFTGADPTYSAARWVEEISDNAEVFAWSPSQKLLMARRALTGVAGLWLRSEKVFKSFDELQRALLKEFPDEVNPKEIHELMTKRKKKGEESCYGYMLVMKELGRRGGFPDYVAIQYIVDGIVDYEINKVMLYGVTTYPDLKEKLKIYEYIKRKMEASGHTRRQSQATWCYNCREASHVASEREFPNDVKFFRCNEFGHKETQCHDSTKQMTIEYDSTVATPSGARSKLSMDVSVKQGCEQRQNSGCANQSQMSVKPHSVMIGVRMDEATNRIDDQKNKTTAIDTKANEVTSKKRQRRPEVENHVNKQKKVEQVCEEKTMEVEKVVRKEYCSGEFASLEKKKDSPTRRHFNKKLYTEINGIRQPIKNTKVVG